MATNRAHPFERFATFRISVKNSEGDSVALLFKKKRNPDPILWTPQQRQIETKHNTTIENNLVHSTLRTIGKTSVTHRDLLNIRRNIIVKTDEELEEGSSHYTAVEWLTRVINTRAGYDSFILR